MRTDGDDRGPRGLGGFGNGDGVYDATEQTAALDAYFNAFFGASRFYAPGRAARIGLELRF